MRNDLTLLCKSCWRRVPPTLTCASCDGVDLVDFARRADRSLTIASVRKVEDARQRRAEGPRGPTPVRGDNFVFFLSGGFALWAVVALVKGDPAHVFGAAVTSALMLVLALAARSTKVTRTLTARRIPDAADASLGAPFNPPLLPAPGALELRGVARRSSPGGGAPIATRWRGRAHHLAVDDVACAPFDLLHGTKLLARVVPEHVQLVAEPGDVRSLLVDEELAAFLAARGIKTRAGHRVRLALATLRDGDEVILRGPKHADAAVAAGYRDVSYVPELRGTAEHPVTISVVRP